MPRKMLLLIGAGKMGVGYLHAAARLGIDVRLVERPIFVDRSAALAQRVVGSASTLHESWYAGALEVLDGDRPDAIVAFSESHVLPAALLQDAFALPGPGMHASVICRDKALQRALFAASRVAQPDFMLVPQLADAGDWVRDRFPVVVKPLGLSGSAGVEALPGMDSFRDAARRRDREGALLVERLIEGQEFSAECLVRDGEVLFTNITVKDTTGEPYFVETCHRPGYRFGAQRALVDAFVRGVLAALRMRTGITHLEFRMTEAGPVLMEVAVRTPGDYIMDAMDLTWGCDVFEAVIELALGHPADLPGRDAAPSASAGVRFVTAPPGRVVRVTGRDLVEAHPAVVRCVLDCEVGDEIRSVHSPVSRVAHVLVRGKDEPERDAALEYAATSLRIDTVPF